MRVWAWLRAWWAVPLALGAMVCFALICLEEAQKPPPPPDPWEFVRHGTHRMRVDGGWLYRTRGGFLGDIEMVFIKDEDK